MPIQNLVLKSCEEACGFEFFLFLHNRADGRLAGGLSCCPEVVSW